MGRRGFAWLAAGTGGTVIGAGALLVGVQASHGSAWWQEEPCAPTETRTAGEPALGAVVHGQLSDPKGDPVEGTEVRATQSVPSLRGATSPEWSDRTDADGCYQLRVTPGALAVVAEPASSRWATRWLTGADSEAGEQPPLEVGEVIRLDATLRPGATLSGQVTVPSAHPATAVLLRRDDPQWSRREAPVKDGRYEFAGLPEGEYAVGVHTTIGTRAYAPRVQREEQARVVRLGEAETIDDVDVEVPAPAVVTGRLTTPQGAGASGTTVSFFNGWGPTLTHTESVTTDGRGRYRVELGPGPWVVATEVKGCGATQLPQVRVRARATSLARSFSTEDLSC
ncbi:carboxypeptidase-like regulatory domain-containing protein [Nocardioides gilvus]|uniref:carboxypeptidase-like regulatory domain-containing protein n=1 Tax=Nocardioides gilvus TaxID=1735589 RepID=UPI0013A560E4|nr:carboxypeptidase-like regulatory domain-containing protein [Nocardioides gilvus]